MPLNVRELRESLNRLGTVYDDIIVYTSNTDSPGENWGYVYLGAVPDSHPEDELKPAIFIR